MTKLLRNHLVHFGITICLAIVFSYAALMKITDRPAFAFDLAQYHLFPFWAINPIAIIFPWIEIIFGVMILFKQWRRAAAVGVIVMVLVFISALCSALLRGLDSHCGCFGQQSINVGAVETLILDSLMASGAVVLICVKPVTALHEDGDHVFRAN